MSHVREIKEKQRIQALFQTKQAETTSMISSWLKPKKEPAQTQTQATSTAETPLKSSHTDFLSLPIISGNHGLSLSDQNDNVNIGQYLENGNKKRSDKPQPKGPQVQRNDSKILEALRNKMKKQATQNIRQNQKIATQYSSRHPQAQQQQQQKKGSNNNSRNSNDSDGEEEVKIVKKKSFGLLIDSKINKKRK